MRKKYREAAQLAKESPGQFKCLGENTERHISFSVPI